MLEYLNTYIHKLNTSSVLWSLFLFFWRKHNKAICNNRKYKHLQHFFFLLFLKGSCFVRNNEPFGALLPSNSARRDPLWDTPKAELISTRPSQVDRALIWPSFHLGLASGSKLKRRVGLYSRETILKWMQCTYKSTNGGQKTKKSIHLKWAYKKMYANILQNKKLEASVANIVRNR